MIGVIVAIYSNYPEALFESCLNSSTELRWYLFLHGQDPTLERRLKEFALSTPNVVLLPYKLNRGLAKSWNDGLRFSQILGDEFAIIANDDLHFEPGGLDAFVDYVRALPPGYGLATMMGRESPDSPAAGQIIPQELACGVIGASALEHVGFFDQNFTPAYFEDTDYVHRLRQARLPICIDERVLVEHDRSKTLRTNTGLQEQNRGTFARNEQFFIRKWGGIYGHTTHVTPFGNPAYSAFIPYEGAEDPYPAERNRPRSIAGGGEESLDEIGLRHGSEKASSRHGFLAFYEREFGARRADVRSILEIGVGGGASLRIWREYFPESRVVGIDNDPKAARHRAEHVTIELIDQSEPRHLLAIAAKHGPFDLVVDDGSHVWDHQILALQLLFPFVATGGLYAIENIDTSYGTYVDAFKGSGTVSAADYVKHLADRVAGDEALQRVHEPDAFIRSYARVVESVTFVPRGCLIKRNSLP